MPLDEPRAVPPPATEEDVPRNPFQVESDVVTPIFEHLPQRSYRSIFTRVLTTFFLLSVTPITLSAVLTAAVYQSSIRQFLPAPTLERIEQVLLAQNILILLLVVILVVFAGSLIAASLVRPLKRLLELTRLVAEGKLEYRLKVTSHDEIGELTEAFNTMVERLHQQQVRERLISQMKSEFISIAAHQLRTPLSAVKWTLKMMLDGDVGTISKEQQDFLARGYDVNERMIQLVGDLLNVARIEEGRFGYRFEEVDFVEYLQKFTARYQDQAARRSVTFGFVPPPAALPPLTVDPSKLDLVLQNLCDNAFKYSAPGGLVRISAQLLPQFVEVTVADTGVGIPRHQLHRVFTKFFRGDNVVRMQTEGSGLGLFIVKNIIKNHGGDIRVESEEGKGTSVIFTLPVSKERIPSREITFEEFVGNL